MKAWGLTALVLAMALFASACGSSQWKVVARATNSSSQGGALASAAMPIIQHPKDLAVRFSGSPARRSASWTCSTDSRKSGRRFGHLENGFHVLAGVKGADSCFAVATSVSSGSNRRVTVEVLVRR